MNEQEIATTDPGGERGRVGTDTTDVADAADATDTTGATGATDAADAGRRLFAYLGGPEWRDYRAIIGVFAGTFFAEFTPDDVSQRLAELGTPLDAQLTENSRTARSSPCSSGRMLMLSSPASSGRSTSHTSASVAITSA